jgi:S1-C subfamily serine protease
LKLHEGYPANKAQLAVKSAGKSEYATPTQIPGLADKPAVATDRRQCIHCHMVKEFALRAKWEQGRLSAADLFVYPLPTAIGLETDLDDGLRISSIKPGTPAASAGLAAGDELVSINGQPLISLADIQWALNTAPRDGQLAVKLKRGSQILDKPISVRGDWKRSDIAWRASSWYGLRKGVKFDPLPPEDRKSRGIHENRLALLVRNIFAQGDHPAKTAGLRQNDVIVAVNGKADAMTESEFLTYLRLTHGPKDSVKFSILRGGERHELTIPMW